MSPYVLLLHSCGLTGGLQDQLRDFSCRGPRLVGGSFANPSSISTLRASSGHQCINDGLGAHAVGNRIHELFDPLVDGRQLTTPSMMPGGFAYPSAVAFP
jgi:hypothetical protein